MSRRRGLHPQGIPRRRAAAAAARARRRGRLRRASPAAATAATAAAATRRPAHPPATGARELAARRPALVDQPRCGAPDAIVGYAGQASVLPGEPVQLYVSTTSREFRVKAFRMGWYARRPGPQGVGVRPGARPPAARRPGWTSATSTVHTDWGPSLTVPTAGWPDGSYLLRLDAHSGAQRYVPLTVRSASTAGKVVLKNAVADLAGLQHLGRLRPVHRPRRGYGDRSLAVSLDRPYDLEGAFLFLVYERKLINLAERHGPAAGLPDQHGHRHRPARAGRRQRADLARATTSTGSPQERAVRHRGQGRRGQPGVPRRQRDVPADPAGPDRARRRTAWSSATRPATSRTRCTARTTRWSPTTGGSRRTRIPESSVTGTLYEGYPDGRGLRGDRPGRLDVRRHRRAPGRPVRRPGRHRVRPGQPRLPGASGRSRSCPTPR